MIGRLRQHAGKGLAAFFITAMWVLAVCLPGALAQNTAQLGEVVVSATKMEQNSLDVPFFVTQVTRDDFEKMGATTLADALRAVPGLQIGLQGNAYPHVEVRGFRDTKDLAVLVNGVPFRQINGSADLTMIPLGIVERIEFVKGPGSSIWGRGAVAGALNIITTPTDTKKLQAKLQAGVGSFNTFQGDARVLAPYEQGYAMLNLGASTSEGFQDRTDREAYNALFSLAHRFNRKFSLGVQGLFSKVDAKRGSTIPLLNGKPAYGVDRSDNLGVDGAKYQGEHQGLTLTPTLKLGDGLTISDVATIAKFDRYSSGGITITPTARNKSWWETDSTQTSLQNDLSLSWRCKFGAARNNFLFGTYLETGKQEDLSPSFSGAATYGPPDWQTPLSNAANGAKGIKGASTETEYKQTIVSFYIQDQVEYGPISFLAGLRYDSFDEELTKSNSSVKSSQQDSAFSPRAGADWKVFRGKDATVALFASYAQGFRTQFPSLSTKNGVTLPQLLDPEETESYEGGLKVSALDGRLFGQASLFQTEKKGPRSFRTTSDDFLYTNARTRVSGLELELRYKLNRMFSFWVNYAYHDAHHLEFTDSSGNDLSGYRVRMSPQHMAGAGVNFAYRSFNWNLTASYVGDRNLRDNTVEAPQNLPSYTVVNTAVSYKFLKRYEVQLVVNNLTDEYYIADDFSSTDSGCAGDPRNFFLWFRASF